MNHRTDPELLREFVAGRSEAAFAELVRRHIDFVHSAARRMVCDAQLAEDVTQAVFVALAGNARQLVGRPVLAGWLHRTARNLAANVVRAEVRRRAREQEAATMNELLADPADCDWERIAPLLDEALGELNEPDRDALFLRYFERKSAREMALLLGVSDEAAQKRVSRAVERLREFFAQRGVTVGAGGLVVTLTANAVQAAPEGLALMISSTALTGATLASAATVTTAKAIAMTTLQKTLVVATITVLAGAGIYEARQASQLRAQVASVRAEHAPLTEQFALLQREREEEARQLARSRAEIADLKRDLADLPRLRGEVTRLRVEAANANDPIVAKALRWKANVEKMKLLFAEHPGQLVPEVKLLSEEDFFDHARDQDLESSNGIRKAYSDIRNAAKNQFAFPLQQALKAFLEANDNKLPVSPLDLKPYFEEAIEDAVLEQYMMLFTGRMSDVKGSFVLRDKKVIDSELDSHWQIGPNAYGPDSSDRQQKQMEATMAVLAPALQAFMQANGGETPTSVRQLKEFLSTPEEKTAYGMAIEEGLFFPPVK